MVSLVAAYSKEIAAIAAVLLAFILNRAFRLRPVLRYGVQHSFNFLVQQPLTDASGATVSPTQIIRTASITIANSGLHPARNVEITFNFQPTLLNVWPARHFSTKDSAHGRHTITLDSLAPAENFGIEILSINAELPLLTAVRSDEATAKLVPMRPQQIQPTWKVALALMLMFCGLALIGYGVASIIERFW